jgi:hypothetical protein
MELRRPWNAGSRGGRRRVGESSSGGETAERRGGTRRVSEVPLAANASLARQAVLRSSAPTLYDLPDGALSPDQPPPGLRGPPIAGTPLAEAGRGTRMPIVAHSAARMAGLMARVSRALAPGHAERARVGRGTRRAMRCAIVLLALGLGVNGIGGLCLCMAGPATGGPAAAHDPHACCPRHGSRHEGVPATGTVIIASAPCCGSQTAAPAFVARIGARDVLPHAPISVTAADVPPAAPAAPATLGASASFVRGASPPPTPVLRI